MTSPITLRRPIFRILFIIRSAAIEEAVKKLLPVIAICRCQKDTFESQVKKGNSLQKLLPIIAICRHQDVDQKYFNDTCMRQPQIRQSKVNNFCKTVLPFTELQQHFLHATYKNTSRTCFAFYDAHLTKKQPKKGNEIQSLRNTSITIQQVQVNRLPLAFFMEDPKPRDQQLELWLERYKKARPQLISVGPSYSHHGPTIACNKLYGVGIHRLVLLGFQLNSFKLNKNPRLVTHGETHLAYTICTCMRVLKT